MNRKINLQILYEDADIVVVNKPAGLLVHRIHEDDTMPNVADLLAEKFPSLRTVGDRPDLRPGIVHRLDKEASGILVVAKTQAAFTHLKEQFKTRTVEKFYNVLVYGKVSKDVGDIHFRLSRSKKTGRMAALPKDASLGREAHTEYEVMARYATATLLRIQIHTGRTHQIRSHMLALGHPVVGDKLYRRGHMRHIRPIETDHLFLHAEELSIDLPSGLRKTFHAELPKELEAILQSLHKV
ncbi:RluA family pseudouridine synthase [Candidatus Uhrbacteria bacterium]|nr:RluA family pseudouridine synthase [Candidatus Uhrbacteria bacterium]